MLCLRAVPLSLLLLVFAPLLNLSHLAVLAQEPNAPDGAAKTDAPAIPEIADEPRTVDPATLVPAPVAMKATLEFVDTMLRDVAKLLEQRAGIPVVFDTQALGDEGILLSDPVTDQLHDEPLYLLLNRLRSHGLAWRVEQNILRISTLSAVSHRMRTEPYNVGDLLDAGFAAYEVVASIQLTPQARWEDIDGEGGSVEMLGDVVFVRQTDAGHHQIAGLLQALRKHARQTFALDPPQHGVLRQKLGENTSVAFQDTPLQAAVDVLAQQAGADIRLDVSELRSHGVREREPVSLALNDRPLRTVLELLLARHHLTWVLRDGVLWITSPEAAQSNLMTAVYDVRDLCRNEDESNALSEAVFGQTSGQWEPMDGVGGTMAFPQPGTMLIVQTEQMHAEILNLLGAYRQALLASKVRQRKDPGLEVSVHYYQLQQHVADVLAKELPRLVAPESWQSDERPDAPGTILLLPSNTTVLSVALPASPQQKAAGMNAGTSTIAVLQSVLVIRQTQNNHDEISKLLLRVQTGDQPMQSGFGGGMGGGGLGGGGFGGGYFSVQPPATQAQDVTTHRARPGF